MNPANPTGKSNTVTWLICLGLLTGTFLIYWPVHTHDFVGIDDPDYVTENPHVWHGLSREGLAWAFTSKDVCNWHPITWLSHMLDCQWFGVQAGPHHLTSVGWHAANAILLFLLFRRVTGAQWQAAVVAAVFAWHPLHVESVAWIAERKDVLSLFFGLLSLLAYVRFVESSKVRGAKSRLWYGVALLCFALGLMSKPMLVTLPGVMLLLDFWPLRRMSAAPARGVQPGVVSSYSLRNLWSLVPEKIPFIALSLGSSAVTVWAQSVGHALGTTEQFPFAARLSNALVVYLAYLGKLFWPAKLAVFYPYPATVPTAQISIAAVVLLTLTVGAIRQATARPYLLFGWLWYLGTLIPVIGLVQVGGQAMADRYTYLPAIGIAVAVCWLFSELTARWNTARIVNIITAVAVIAACTVTTVQQLPSWRDSQSLFEHARNVTDRNYLAWTVLGGFLSRAGRVDEAINYFETSLTMQPNYAGALSGLGNAYAQRGDFEKALSYHEAALRLSPYEAESVNDRAVALAKLGRLAEAQDGFLQSLKLRPQYGDATFNLAMLLNRSGKLNEALARFEESVALMPNSTNAHYYYGSALMRASRPADALREFDRTLELLPGGVDARYGRGLALMDLGRINEAADAFRSLLELTTNRAPALDGLGFVLAIQGQVDSATKHFQEALQLDPKLANAHLHYGMVLASQRRFLEALREYRNAVELEPNQPAALNNLAWMLATQPDAALRNGQEAVTFALRACELTGRREPFLLGTLAAAYAEAGDFAQAVVTAKLARDQATNAGRPDLAKRNNDLLTWYEASQPYRDVALRPREP